MKLPRVEQVDTIQWGNGQCEKYNGIVWQTVLLALKSNNLPVSQWENVLPQALHSIRSLLCTSTNCTPHERFFCFVRKSKSGTSLPSWLKPGPVLLKKKVRTSKYDPAVEKVELLQANPQYAFVKMSSGKECTVSLRDLAPCGETHTNDHFEQTLQTSNKSPDVDNLINSPRLQSTPNKQCKQSDNANLFSPSNTFVSDPRVDGPSPVKSSSPGTTNKQLNLSTDNSNQPLRRSTRERKPPEKLDL